MSVKLNKNESTDNKITERGNCLVQCLSFITNIPLENIPQFENMPAGAWKRELPKWLHSINIQLSKRYSVRSGNDISIGVGICYGERHAMVFQGSTPIYDCNKPEDHKGPIVGMDMEYYLYLDTLNS